MGRRTFADILDSAGFDINREYSNLYHLFFGGGRGSFWNIINDNFSPEFFGDTSVSLSDFDTRYGFKFEEHPAEVSLDEFVLLCEYEFNLLERSAQLIWARGSGFTEKLNRQCTLILRNIENAHYRAVGTSKGLTIFVERDVAADAASEVLPDPLSWEQLTYGHRSLKGNIEGKKRILLSLGDWLEPRREQLKQANSKLCSLVFGCLNNLDLRHNNIEAGRHYNAAFAALSKEEREDVYDDVYQLLLIAVLEVDSSSRLDRLHALIQDQV